MSSLRSIDSLHSQFVHAVSVKKEDSNKHSNTATVQQLPANRPEECRIFHILLHRSLQLRFFIQQELQLTRSTKGVMCDNASNDKEFIKKLK